MRSPPWGFLFFGWAIGPIFIFRDGSFLNGPKGTGVVTGSLRERLIALIEPRLERLGYELVDLEYAAGRGHALVRLFIDAPAQVTAGGLRQR